VIKFKISNAKKALIFEVCDVILHHHIVLKASTHSLHNLAPLATSYVNI